MANMKTKLSKTNRMVKCRSCGKLTHSSIQGSLDISLCRACFDDAGAENYHSDNHHTGSHIGCPVCAAEL